MPINPAVTDPVLLSQLNRESVNASDVTFTQDYAHRDMGNGHSPYAKFYSHSNGQTKYMVTSGLPMIDNSGDPLTPGWRLNGSGVYISEKNLMTASIQGTAVELVVRNADTFGRAAGATLGFTPRVTVGGVVVTPSAPTLLATDPDNSAYSENVLEWNYGTFTRRLRQVQGRVHGKWIFPANPGGDVRITYNQTGDYRLKLGEYAANADEEFIPESVFLDAETVYPFTVGDSTTFNPDAHTESTSVDGQFFANQNPAGGAGLPWADLIAADGTQPQMTTEDDTDTAYVGWGCGGVTNQWRIMWRAMTLFDTSGLGSTATVSAGVLSLYGYDKSDPLSDAGTTNIYTAAPASDTGMVDEDFDNFGGTAQAADITYASFNVSGYNDFTLNSTGEGNIAKTGITKFGQRNANYDVAATAPSWSSFTSAINKFYMAEKGASYKPKLVVTYTVPATGKGFFGMM